MTGTFHRGFEFDAMAHRPLYDVCPSWLIEACEISADARVVDLGCGSGLLTETLLQRFPAAPDLRIVAVDPSEYELQLLQARVDDPRVSVHLGRAEDAAAHVSDADAVLLCNVLHQIPLADRGGVFQGIFELLRPGGVVGANTLFYDGSVREDPGGFYTHWMLATRRALAARGIPGQFATAVPVALQQLTPEQHRALPADAGFVDIRIEEIDTAWGPEDWAALCQYSVFIQGALWPDVDLAAGRDALIDAVHATYRKLELELVHRGWLHCAARRPGVS